jgi:hypothetical protein
VISSSGIGAEDTDRLLQRFGSLVGKPDRICWGFAMRRIFAAAVLFTILASVGGERGPPLDGRTDRASIVSPYPEPDRLRAQLLNGPRSTA